MSDDACSDSPKPRHRILKRVLVAVAIVLVACVGGFLLWASDYYHADATAMAVEQQDSTIEGSVSKVGVSGAFAREPACY